MWIPKPPYVGAKMLDADIGAYQVGTPHREIYKCMHDGAGKAAAPIFNLLYLTLLSPNVIIIPE